jgi:tetratricopeptide (TPR) repeat protein
MLKKLSAATILLLLFSRVDLGAHGDLHEQIESVSGRIRKNPTPELFLKRGELHRAHHDHQAALADYDRAQELDPTLDALRFCRGRTLFEAGKLPLARAELDQFLQKQPRHAEGYLTRARVLAKLEELPAATADFDRAIELSSEPRPEYFVERARVQIDLGDLEDAINGLESGMQRLGAIATLQTLAIEVELKLQRFDAALKRVDSLVAQAERKETWMARRGEILALAGRRAEAAQAYTEALSSIELLPAPLRNTRATIQLEKRLRTAADKLAGNPG